MKILRFNEAHNIAGNNIKKLRRERNLTQEQVVARMQTYGIQIDQKAISRIENGDRIITDYELKRFAQILNTTVENLLRDSVYDPGDENV